MRRTLILCLVVAVGAAAARVFDGISGMALAGGENGGGGESCAAVNGDVNADGSVDISDAVTILGNLFLGEPAQLAPLCKPRNLLGLPETGQSACYNFIDEDQGWISVPCGQANCRGQDGAYMTGCSQEERFIDNGDGTITDICTGLMWQKETADVDGSGELKDQDRVLWCTALNYCENLSFAGYDDWRLPNIKELQSIVDYGRILPAIDQNFGTLTSWYWSSTSHVFNHAYAWALNFDGGIVYDLVKEETFPVRAVRGGR